MGRMLALSVLLHILIVVFVSGLMFNRAPVPERQSYKVNLVNRPVDQPRRGHPAATPETKTAVPAPRQEPVAAKPATPKPAPKPEAASKPAAVPKPAPKPEAIKKVEVPAPAPTKIKTPEKKATPAVKAEVQPAPKAVAQPLSPMLSPADIERMYQQDTHARIEEISTRIEQLKRQLAAQATAQSPVTTTVSTEKVGSASGTGTQEGIAFEEWIREYLAQHWTLPSTHWGKGLRSTVVLRFDAQGNRTGYTVLSASGDSLFDQSVEQCVERLQTLPAAPGKSRAFSIIFDPNEMLKK